MTDEADLDRRLRSAARRVAGASTGPPTGGRAFLPVARAWGTVEVVNAAPTSADAPWPSVDVACLGTTFPQVRFSEGYAPSVGDKVMVDVVDGDPFIVGAASGDPDVPGTTFLYHSAAGATNGDDAYWPGVPDGAVGVVRDATTGKLYLTGRGAGAWGAVEIV